MSGKPGIPIIADVDVAVVGGASGGVAAAAAAARAGARVFLAAAETYLGEDLCGPGRLFPPGEAPLGTDLARRLLAEPGGARRAWLRPLEAKRLLEEELLAAGVNFLFGCAPANLLAVAGRAAGVVLACRSGLFAVRARAVIDATREALLARLAGAPFGGWNGGEVEFRRLALGGEAAGAGDGGPRFLGNVSVRQQGQLVERGAWEYELKLRLADGSPAAWAEAEQAARDRTWHPDQVWASERLWYVPPTALASDRPYAWEGDGELPLDAFVSGRPGLFVLGPCAAVTRAAAARLLEAPWALAAGERCVCELHRLVGGDLSTVSKHLAVMKQAGIVEDRKKGLLVYYRLRVPCILRIFDCVEAVLDRTAFYPSSGGQPHDLGTLGGAAVREVIEGEADRVIHVLDRPLETGLTVEGEVDWARRFDHMQQHTGQHLLSAVIHEMFGWQTLSFHLGAAVSTIDLETGAIAADQLERAEREANLRIVRNLPVSVSFEDSESAQGLRKESSRSGELRVVSIEGLDRSACGGTHVRATGEIGCLLIRRQEKVRGSVRIEFVCGLRAAARARADFNLLSAVARHFSASLEETPALVASLMEQAKESEKARRKLALDLAAARGRELYASTPAGEGGRRIHIERCRSLGEEERAAAQSFTSKPGARFIAVCADPPSLLYAVSEGESAAGAVLREALAASGGRGGGNARMAQGSLPDAAALEAAAAWLAARTEAQETAG